MLQTSAAQTRIRKSGIRTLFTQFTPALVALSFGLTAFKASALPVDAQNAINAKLKAFQTDVNSDPQVPGTVKVTSTVTAKAADLLLAIAAATEDPANSAIGESDFAQAVLIAGANGQTGVTDAGKFRTDKDKIIASVIDQIVQSRNISGNASSVANLLDGALANAKTPLNTTGTGLTSAGQAAAIGQALKSATASNSGATFAQRNQVKTVINAQGTDVLKQKLVATSIVDANTGTGATSGNVRSFLNGLMDQSVFTTASQQAINSNLLGVAKLVKKFNAAVGEVVGAAADRTTDTADGNGKIAALDSLATTALSAPAGLKAAASQIVAAIGEKYKSLSGNLVTFATTVATGQDKKTTGLIAGGAISAADDADTLTIYNNLKAVVTSPADKITFAANAAIGNDSTKVGKITTQANTDVGAGNESKLGKAIVAAISLVNPDSAFAVGSALATTAASKETLAGDLAKASKSADGAGMAAAGVANGLPNTGATNSKTSIAIAANKAASKFVSDITMEIGANFVVPFTTPQPSYAITDFAKALASANTAAASAIAVGASMADPILADQIVDKVVTLTGGKIKASAAKIVQAVGTAVDVEEVAEIVTQLSTHFTFDGKAKGTVTGDDAIKVSNAAAIATAAANAIQLKPDVATDNRKDELGESAASIVGQLIAGYKNGNLVLATDPTKAPAALAKLISGVTASFIKTLSKTELVDTLTQKADLTAAANIAGDVANTVKQAITSLGLAQADADAIKAQLVKDIPKLGGKGYGDPTNSSAGPIHVALNDGFAGTNNAATRFEDGTQVTPASTDSNHPDTLNTGTRTGSVIDPESDTRPG